MSTVLRYLLYIAFVFAAIVFWMILGAMFLGIAPGDPACVAEGYPCPVPSAWAKGAKMLIGWAAMPLTALTFVFYRRGVRRVLGMD